MRRLCALLLVLPLAAGGAIALAATRSAPAQRRSTHMHGHRYCEYFVVKGKLPKLTADVWNTYGLGTCPAKQWRATNAGALAKSLGALTVVLNGPRYWLVDSTRITLPHGSKVTKFPSGLRMRLVASIDVPITNGVPGTPPYREVTIYRRNTFTWSKRYPVYELVSPKGRVYVMQSFARIRDPHLSLAQLPKLRSRLKLPAGWRYRVRRLSHDLTLVARGHATIVQDDLQDTYQRVTRAR